MNKSNLKNILKKKVYQSNTLSITNTNIIKILLSKKLRKIKPLATPRNIVLNGSTKRLPPSELRYATFHNVPVLPPRFDLRPKFQPILNQGNLGSCTANAFAALLGYLKPELFASRLYLYYYSRALSKNTQIDSGATLKDGIIVLKNKGVCQESAWPYYDLRASATKWSTKPDAICDNLAKKYKIKTYANIQNNLNTMKLCLLSKIPFILGIAIYDSFFVNKNPANGVPVGGIITTPNKTTDTQIGGHAVVCVGYKDSTNHFIIRNSWGFNSGDGGYLYLPYDYITNTEFTSDIWIITKML